MSLQTRLTALATAIGADIKLLNGKVTTATKTLDKWHNFGDAGEPPLAAGFANAVAGTKAGFTKDMLGRVQVRGWITGPSGGGVVATLPIGYWPTQAVRWMAAGSAGGVIVGQYLYVLTNGQIVAVGANNVNNATVWDLSSIDFDTEAVTELSVLITGVSQETLPIEAWRNVGVAGNPAFQGTWGHHAATLPVQFRKKPDGMVEIRGFARGSAAGVSPIFRLPAAYLPASGQDVFYFPATVEPGGSPFITIHGTTGDVSMAGAYTAAQWVNVTCQFPATQTTWPVGPQGPKGDPGGNAPVPIEPWLPITAPMLTNNWVAGSIAPRYRKNPFGQVRLSGLIKNGTIGSSAITLPVGYRPAQTVELLGSANGALGGVAITSGGLVIPFNGSNTYVALDEIEFDTELVTTMPSGPQGPKGDPGGVNVVTTTDWNTAVTPNFYRSPHDDLGMAHAVNGPGDTVNVPQQAGIVSVHENGSIAQRVWDLYAQVAYTRYRRAGTWTAWVPDVGKPRLDTDLTFGGPTPIDGEERYFQTAAMKAAGIIWKFRYNAGDASSYKWGFVGGGPLAIEGQSGSTTASAMTAFGTGLTLPLAGDYMMKFGASLTRTNVSEWLWVFLDMSDGVKATQGARWQRSAAANESHLSLGSGGRILGAAAEGIWRLRLGNSNNASQVLAEYGWMEIIPLRVFM